MSDDQVPPAAIGIHLYEVYEESGALLLVTSAYPTNTEKTDRVFIRRWSTADEAKKIRRGWGIPRD